ncbi:MAG: hypothetical protein U9Q15_02085 [Patescibacteria group bacterium]|nr:hypothetical protein [Patescibacteria group bacterium]
MSKTSFVIRDYIDIRLRKSLSDILFQTKSSASTSLEEYIQFEKKYLQDNYDKQYIQSIQESYREAQKNKDQTIELFHSSFDSLMKMKAVTHTFYKDAIDEIINRDTTSETASAAGEILALEEDMEKYFLLNKNIELFLTDTFHYFQQSNEITTNTFPLFHDEYFSLAIPDLYDHYQDISENLMQIQESYDNYLSLISETKDMDSFIESYRSSLQVKAKQEFHKNKSDFEPISFSDSELQSLMTTVEQ